MIDRCRDKTKTGNRAALPQFRTLFLPTQGRKKKEYQKNINMEMEIKIRNLTRISNQ